MITFYVWPQRPIGDPQIADMPVGALAVDGETGIAIVVESERSPQANRQLAERRLAQLVTSQAASARADDATVTSQTSSAHTAGASVKLSALVAARSKMTSGEYFVAIEHDAHDPALTRTIVESTGCGAIANLSDSSNADADATGIVATHNAAPVLIEIAQRAHAWYDALSRDIDYDVQDAACDALAAAVGKITP